MAKVFRRRQLRAAPCLFVPQPDQHVWTVGTSVATTAAVGCSPSCLGLTLRANVQGWGLVLQTAPGGHMPSSVCMEISLGGERANSSQWILGGVRDPPVPSGFLSPITFSFQVIPRITLASSIYNLIFMSHAISEACHAARYLQDNVCSCPCHLPSSISRGPSLHRFFRKILRIISPTCCAYLHPPMPCLVPSPRPYFSTP